MHYKVKIWDFHGDDYDDENDAEKLFIFCQASLL